MISLAQIVSHKESRVFTLAETRELFPLVRRITSEAHVELEPVRRKLEVMLPSNPRLPEVEKRYEAVVRRWVSKMERLGLLVKGLWLIGFDTGDGYLCWKFPELQLAYYREYSQCFRDRRPLAEVIEELDPDWA